MTVQVERWPDCGHPKKPGATQCATCYRDKQSAFWKQQQDDEQAQIELSRKLHDAEVAKGWRVVRWPGEDFERMSVWHRGSWCQPAVLAKATPGEQLDEAFQRFLGAPESEAKTEATAKFIAALERLEARDDQREQMLRTLRGS